MTYEFAMTAFYIACCIAAGWIGYWIRVAQEQQKDQRIADLDRYWHERKTQLARVAEHESDNRLAFRHHSMKSEALMPHDLGAVAAQMERI